MATTHSHTHARTHTIQWKEHLCAQIRLGLVHLRLLSLIFASTLTRKTKPSISLASGIVQYLRHGCWCALVEIYMRERDALYLAHSLALVGGFAQLLLCCFVSGFVSCIVSVAVFM